MNIKINVLQDWVDLLKYELSAHGFKLDPMDDDNTVGVKYFNYCKRMVKPKLREIKKSMVFSCPSDLLMGLTALENKIRNALDLTPHLSTRITDINYNDELLNDWGIHHLHLGTAPDSHGFVNRTGPLLFVRFDDRIAYFINVMPHGSWTKQEMLRVIHINWPESIADYRIENIVGLVDVPSDDDIKAFRRANVNTMIEVEPGIVYSQPGGGYASCGVSARAVRANNWYRKKMIHIEESFRNGLNDLLLENGRPDLIKEPELEFHLQIDGRRLFLVEKSNRISIAWGEL